MSLERTLSIIKPDAVENGYIGNILQRFEKNGLKIIACKMVWLSKACAEEFYGEHKARGFFASLVEYMTSGPVVVSVLEGENAVTRNREMMGATDPAKADAGTIRKDLGEALERNAAHGSDSVDSATREIARMFGGLEIFSYKRVK